MNNVEIRAILLSLVLFVLALWSLSWWEGPALPSQNLQLSMYLLTIATFLTLLFMILKNRRIIHWFVWTAACLASALFLKMAYVLYSGITLGQK
jgi:hypothetical protein